jgi:hypothetical protein
MVITQDLTLSATDVLVELAGSVFRDSIQSSNPPETWCCDMNLYGAA